MLMIDKKVLPDKKQGNTVFLFVEFRRSMFFYLLPWCCGIELMSADIALDQEHLSLLR